MARVMWVRVTGCTVYAFPEQQTGSQLTDAAYQVGNFRGTGAGATTAVGGSAAAPAYLGGFETRLEAIAAILRDAEIIPTDDSVGIR